MYTDIKYFKYPDWKEIDIDVTIKHKWKEVTKRHKVVMPLWYNDNKRLQKIVSTLVLRDYNDM